MGFQAWATTDDDGEFWVWSAGREEAETEEARRVESLVGPAHFTAELILTINFERSKCAVKWLGIIQL